MQTPATVEFRKILDTIASEVEKLSTVESNANTEVERAYEALTNRYNYLVLGGTFQVQEGNHPYLNGFMDALLTLREQVKP